MADKTTLLVYRNSCDIHFDVNYANLVDFKHWYGDGTITNCFDGTNLTFFNLAASTTLVTVSSLHR